MDGFDKEGYSAAGNPGGYNQLAGDVPYHYIQRSDVQPYWDLAEQYTLADDMFSTQSSGTTRRTKNSSPARPTSRPRVV